MGIDVDQRQDFFALAYDEVDGALAALGSQLEAAECQGTLCGMLCSREELDVSAWVRQLVNDPHVSAAAILGQQQVLLRLVQLTIRGISSRDFTLGLLLPDDEQTLATRADALGAWSRGFVFGFGLTGTPWDQMSADAQDFLRDLERIANIEDGEISSDADEHEEREKAYVELCEYARIGTIMMHEEAQAFKPQPGTTSSTLH